MEASWSPEEYVLVFTSDHGEAFDANHPKEHHDFSLYTAVLHVPLMIQSPWRRGETVQGLASHLDIMPTLANLVGEPPDPLTPGSLGPPQEPGSADSVVQTVQPLDQVGNLETLWLIPPTQTVNRP